MALPEVEVTYSDDERASYSVRKKSFVFSRPPRPDAMDNAGERLTDVVAIYTPGLDDKDALVQDEASPFFTTPHWNGYRAVLVRERDLGQLSVQELREIVTDAWLSRAPKRLANTYLATGPG